jgi:hypothetical protein
MTKKERDDYNYDCNYYNCRENEDPCPNCGIQLMHASGGGVKCPNPDCHYWFCY